MRTSQKCWQFYNWNALLSIHIVIVTQNISKATFCLIVRQTAYHMAHHCLTIPVTYLKFLSTLKARTDQITWNETDWSQALVLWQALSEIKRPRSIRLWNISHFYPRCVPWKCRDLNIHIVGVFVIVKSLLYSHCSHVLSLHQGLFGVHLLLRKSRGLLIT